MRATAIMLLAGLLAACGDNGADETAASGAGDSSQPSSEPLAAASSAAIPSSASAGEGPGAQSGGVATGAAASAAGPGGAAGLPLELGFYVSSDTACSNASNATLQLLRRDGMNTSDVECDFTRVEKVGASSYRVTQTCTDDGEAFGQDTQVTSDTSTFEIPSRTSVRIVYEGGGSSTYKYCAQSSLPEPWRNNDISDIVG